MTTTIKGSSPKREGQCSLRSSNGMAVFDETYSYIVESTSKTEPYDVVITTTGLPLPGVSVSPSGFGICQATSATRWDDNPHYWTVTAEFSSEVEENQNSQDPRTDPLVWVPIYETKFERIQELSTTDVDGDTIANSVGQPFETGVSIPRFILVWEFYQFEPATVTDEQIADRNETVNSAVFKGRAAKTLLLNVVTSSVGYYYGRKMRLTKYQLRYNKKNWRHKRADTGREYLSGGVLTPVKVNGGVGSLNGSGGKQAAGTAPATLEFDIFEEKAFATFLRV